MLKWLRIKLTFLRYDIYKWWHDRLPCWIACHLPKKVQYWAAIHVGAHATTGLYSNQLVPELRFLEALERWERDNAL